MTTVSGIWASAPASIAWRIEGDTVWLPALATAHSHAFQRMMRGKAQRPSEDPSDSFWSWRGQMYAIANRLTPESMQAIARVAFRELYASGVRTVGEFHYVHHATNGVAYADRTVMSQAVIEAAKDVGLRICLIRTAYHRAGPGRLAEEGQRRFCDPSVDDVLCDLDALRSRYADDPNVRIGVAPHSVRAVPPSWLVPLADYARTHAMPFHMHVAEQPREIEECLAETKKRPVELLADLGVLSPRFVAVHGTHLLPHEATLLGTAASMVCLCPTTERDLGDGLCDLPSLRDAGVRLCTGIDSHVVCDPIEELRSLETHARLATGKRVTFAPHGASPAEDLWKSGSWMGAIACGFEDPGGEIAIDRAHPTLALVEDSFLLDAIVFSAHPGVVRR